jgi:putative FmdB family regulatory protein
MPTYEYVCSSCANEWEFEQSIKEDALKECPRCHKQSARRQISRGAGFILKGGGWYSDLYSSSSNKAPGGGNSEAKATDAKPKGEASPSTSGSGSGGTSSGGTEGGGSSSGGSGGSSSGGSSSGGSSSGGSGGSGSGGSKPASSAAAA